MKNRNLVKFWFAYDAISHKQTKRKHNWVCLLTQFPKDSTKNKWVCLLTQFPRDNTKHKWACLLTQFPKDRQYTKYNSLVTEIEFVSWPASRISCLDTTRPDLTTRNKNTHTMWVCLLTQFPKETIQHINGFAY